MKSMVACTALLFFRLVCNRILQVINIHIKLFFLKAGQVGPNTDLRPEVHPLFWPKPDPIIYQNHSMPLVL